MKVTKKPMSGENNGRAKLTEAKVLEIRALRGPFNGKRLHPAHPMSLAALARQFGISSALISRISLGHSWKHVS